MHKHFYEKTFTKRYKFGNKNRDKKMVFMEKERIKNRIKAWILRINESELLPQNIVVLNFVCTNLMV